MYAREITSEDLDGNKITQLYYFNLNKAELIDMEVSEDGGLEKYMLKIVKEEDQKKLIELFKIVILKAYGRRSEDNIRFIKSDEIREEFQQTDAYSELFWELATDAEKGAQFFINIIPKNLAKALGEGQKVVNLPIPDVAEKPNWESPDVPKTVYTRDELETMTAEDFDRLVGHDPQKMTHLELQVAMKRRNVSL